MGNQKLVWCCIIGILLGFIVPMVFKLELSTCLMVGMVGGLGVGYLLDSRDRKQAGEDGQLLLNEKAKKANQLMARARRGVENEYLRMDYDDEEPTAEEAEDEAPSEEDPDTLTPVTDYGAEAEEEAQKLSKAEELLRAARERIGRSEQDAENEYPRTPSADYDEETEEARKLSEAEELLRAARERMK